MSARNRQNWMWADACELLSQAERLHRQFFQLGNSAQRLSWEPPIDMIESERELLLVVALPGIEPTRVHLAVKGNDLLIDAVRPTVLPPRSGFDATVHRLEIPYGQFARRVRLPPGSYELVEEVFRHGCLQLRFVKH
jgi:HSP20 family protein